MNRVRKILIAEDEALTAMMLAAQLRRLGFDVCESVKTGEKAILLAEAERPDLVLMDVGLSGPLNGQETARAIRSRFDVPVVFMTGYGGEEFLNQLAAFRPVAVLIKPIQMAELEAVLAAAFGTDPTGDNA